jgi:hypothetical protein
MHKGFVFIPIKISWKPKFVKVSGKYGSAIVELSTDSAGAIGVQEVSFMSATASLQATPPIPSHSPQGGL